MIRKLVALLFAINIIIGGVGVVAAESNDSVLFEHSSDVALTNVEYVDNHAIVSMTSDSGGEDVIITDSSRTSEGEMQRYRFTLNEGSNEFEIPLHNPSNGAVTVDSEGSMYLSIADSSMNLLPTISYPILTMIGGVVLTLALILGLDLLANRKSKTAFNPLK